MVMDVQLDFDFDHCQLNSPPLEAVQDYFRNLEFKTMVNRLPKIMARFNEYATAGVASTGGTSRITEISAYPGGSNGGSGDNGGGGGAAVAVQVESATIIIEPIPTLAQPPAPDVGDYQIRLGIR